MTQEDFLIEIIHSLTSNVEVSKEQTESCTTITIYFYNDRFKCHFENGTFISAYKSSYDDCEEAWSEEEVIVKASEIFYYITTHKF